MSLVAQAPATFHPQGTQQAAALAQMLAFATGEHGASAMVLKGYAGTGKTTLVGEMIRRMAGKLAIAVTAPTHKAVNVLREKIGPVGGIEFATLHSLLGLRLTPQSDGRYRCAPEGTPTFADYDLVVIDEASMIHRALFAEVVGYAGHGTRVLFVGDPAQLPPVEDHNEASLVFSRIQHQAMLTEVCRQAAEHPAIALSIAIRAAIERGERLDASRLAKLCATADSDVLFAHGGGVTAFNWALHELRAGRDTRILAWTNDAVRAYNRELHAALHGDATPFVPDEALMLNDSHDARADAGGDPLQARKVMLFNSEETLVRDIVQDTHSHHPDVPAWRVAVTRDNGERCVMWIAADEEGRQQRRRSMFAEAADIKRRLAAHRDSELDARRRQIIAAAWALTNDFADARHVYAMTVHKSQGSTFDTAIVDLANLARNRGEEYNQLLYVAATRPRYHLALVA